VGACFIGTRINFANGSARASFFSSWLGRLTYSSFRRPSGRIASRHLHAQKFRRRHSATLECGEEAIIADGIACPMRSRAARPSRFFEAWKLKLCLRTISTHAHIQRMLRNTYRTYTETHTENTRKRPSFRSATVSSNMLFLLQAMSSYVKRIACIQSSLKAGGGETSALRNKNRYADSATRRTPRRITRTSRVIRWITRWRYLSFSRWEGKKNGRKKKNTGQLPWLGFLRRRASLNSHWACSSFRRGAKVTRFACTRFFLLSLSLCFCPEYITSTRKHAFTVSYDPFQRSSGRSCSRGMLSRMFSASSDSTHFAIRVSRYGCFTTRKLTR